MGDWDDFADDLALAWWLSDRDETRTEHERAREDERADADAVRKAWEFRRDVALRSAGRAAERWNASVDPASGRPATAGEEVEEAVEMLVTLGFTPTAARAALAPIGRRGATVEARVVEAILAPPPTEQR